MQHPSPAFFAANRSRLLQRLPPGSVAILCSNDSMPRNGDQFFPFRQNSDFYYCTGITQDKTLLLLAREHPLKGSAEQLFIAKPDAAQERWTGKKLDRASAGQNAALEAVYWLDELPDALNKWISGASSVFINLQDEYKSKSESKNWNNRMADTLELSYPGLQPKSLAPYMQELRLRKSPEELLLIREACRITGEAFHKAFRDVTPGMWEYQLEAGIHSTFIQNRACPAFSPIIAGGANACTLHYTSNNSPLRAGDLLLIDIGAEYSNYAADCTRTFPVNGSFNSRQLELYSALHQVQKKMLPRFVPGTCIELLNQEMAQLMEECLLKLGLLDTHELENQNTSAPLYKNFSIHGLSHFIGLDVHDPGTRQTILEPGMVLSCEPGMYIPDEGIGIRIEDQVLITQAEPEVLTAAIPSEPGEIISRMHPS